MNSIAIIILTFNEELHIKRCINNLKKISDQIYIVDSYSTDLTCEIAESLGAIVLKNRWPGNHAIQFNWALDNCPIKAKWTMRMDCDEYLSDELIEEINSSINDIADNIGGFIIKRKVFFMNKWIKHGGFYPQRLIRIWRTGNGRLEDRWMDEHVVLSSGLTKTLTYDMVDHNLNDLSWWINKHNNYASREVIDLIDIARNTTDVNNVKASLVGEQHSRKRWIKENVYSQVPLFVRPFAYFIYRYILLLGFLDGTKGLVWHFLQGFWYRFLIDAKMYELKQKNSKKGILL